jgi:hypothetical protein
MIMQGRWAYFDMWAEGLMSQKNVLSRRLALAAAAAAAAAAA